VRNLLTLTDQASPQEWDAFIQGAPDGHLLQMWPWGELKSRFGWSAVRVAVQDRGQIVAAAQVLLRTTPLGRLAYIPRGPVAAPDQPELCETLMRAVSRACRARGVMALKVEPDWVDSPERRQLLARLGFASSQQTVQAPRTIHVDLRPDPEAILGAMKSKTRYNIRLAERKGVVVREGGQADLGAFCRLMAVTGERDGFGVHSPEYYALAWRLFAPRNLGRLFLAEYEGQLLAGLMAFAAGTKSWYLYGASSNEQRNLMPTYLIQWAAMQWAKEKGCHTYDLCGIPDLDEEVLEAALESDQPLSPPSPLWGVYRFKRGFGGQMVRYVGAYDYVYSAWRYRLFLWLLEKRKAMAGY